MKTEPTPRTDEQHAMFPMGGFTLDFCRQLERELAEARKQRDTLAEALERCLDYSWDGPMPDYARQPANKALAAVKGGEA